MSAAGTPPGHWETEAPALRGAPGVGRPPLPRDRGRADLVLGDLVLGAVGAGGAGPASRRPQSPASRDGLLGGAGWELRGGGGSWGVGVRTCRPPPASRVPLPAGTPPPRPRARGGRGGGAGLRAPPLHPSHGRSATKTTASAAAGTPGEGARGPGAAPAPWRTLFSNPLGG